MVGVEERPKEQSFFHQSQLDLLRSIAGKLASKGSFWEYYDKYVYAGAEMRPSLPQTKHHEPTSGSTRTCLVEFNSATDVRYKRVFLVRPRSLDGVGGKGAARERSTTWG
jgi:hypothetical protein